jgi:RHS repeat-associated protein
VTYAYDSGANAKGHLTSLIDQAGTASYTYDILGRLATETRILTGANNAAISKNISYTYNLDGSIKSLTYPSGKVITYTPDSAGRVLSAIDSGSGTNYVTGATYGATSALTGFISGNSGTFAGITSAFSYNKRLQPVNMSATAPSQTVYSIGYDFHVGNNTTGSDNGNVFGIYNFRDRNRDQTFTYDALNRLTSAQNAGTNCAATVVGGKTEYWGNTYGYDAWGNLLAKAVTKCSAENFSVAALANNQLSGYAYDAAGNMTHDVTSGLSYTFDQENRLTGANGYTYTYDSDGNRVRKSNGNLAANGTLYWAMTPGVVAETDLAGTTKSEYIFFEGERVARRDGATGTGGVFYYFSDNLKTASVITDSAGTIKAESDYYPWGGELQFTNNDSNDYKFTGKKRDTETGLDYFGARYYSNGLGRWVSADWSATPLPVPYADFNNPQTLNLYGYMWNNPLGGTDKDGHCGQQQSGGGSSCPSVTVTVKADSDPHVMHNQPPNPDIAKVGTTTTVKITDGHDKPIAEAKVQENPSTTNNLTGTNSGNQANPNPVTTAADGTFKDIVAQQVVAEPTSTAEIQDHVNKTPYDKTTNQTLTITTSGAKGTTCTCTATYSEHMSNVTNGKLDAPNASGTNYKLMISPVEVKPTPQ